VLLSFAPKRSGRQLNNWEAPPFTRTWFKPVTGFRLLRGRSAKGNKSIVNLLAIFMREPRRIVGRLTFPDGFAPNHIVDRIAWVDGRPARSEQPVPERGLTSSSRAQVVDKEPAVRLRWRTAHRNGVGYEDRKLFGRSVESSYILFEFNAVSLAMASRSR